jgi:hypothetical protein
MLGSVVSAAVTIVAAVVAATATAAIVVAAVVTAATVVTTAAAVVTAAGSAAAVVVTGLGLASAVVAGLGLASAVVAGPGFASAVVTGLGLASAVVAGLGLASAIVARLGSPSAIVAAAVITRLVDNLGRMVAVIVERRDVCRRRHPHRDALAEGRIVREAQRGGDRDRAGPGSSADDDEHAIRGRKTHDCSFAGVSVKVISSSHSVAAAIERWD